MRYLYSIKLKNIERIPMKKTFHKFEITTVQCGYNLENNHLALTDTEVRAAIALKIL